MIVEDVGIEDAEGAPALAATIRSQRGAFEPFRARYIVPDGDPGWLAPTADPFVVALLLACDAIGEELRVEGPVSPALLAAVPTIVEIVRTWVPTRFDWRDAWKGSGEPVKVVAAEERAEQTRASGTGLFFSLGVDSFHALLTDAGGPPTASHLVFADGFDLLPADRIVFRQAVRAVRDVAAATGTAPVVVRPNIRPFVERMVPWGITWGSWLASAGLALGGLLSRVRIAASLPYAHLVPAGSHPLLDPLWSTEATAIQHVGAASGRAEKLLDVVARSELAVGHLRVCFRGPPKGLYNCGECPKCLSTMVGLRAAGAPEPWPTFPRPLRAVDVLRRRSGPTGMEVLMRSAPLLRARGQHALAAAAWLVALRRWFAPRVRSLTRKMVRR